MNKIYIHTDFIKLEQALKLAELVMSGGEAKEMIQSSLVCVNGEIETRRGRKLYPNDIFSFDGNTVEVAAENEG